MDHEEIGDRLAEAETHLLQAIIKMVELAEILEADGRIIAASILQQSIAKARASRGYLNSPAIDMYFGGEKRHG